jgi:hypothetical protein
MRERDLLAALEKWLPGQSEKTLQSLLATGQVQAVERRGERFWSAAQAKYCKP